MRGGDAAPAVTAAAPPAPAAPGLPVLKSAGTGQPALNSVKVEANVSISSKGDGTAGITSGPYTNLGAQVINNNGYDILRFNMAPGASVITNQETMSYMDGGLVTGATTGTGGLFSALLRGITGASMLQNSVVNSTSNTLKMTLSPLLQGSLIQIDIQPGETWRFADKAFVAATPNLVVGGNINIFSNFRMMFIGENLTYTTVAANQGTAGSVWVSSYGAIEKHEIEMGTGSTVPLFINNGCFLGMLDNNGAVNFWNDYVSVGTANGFFSAMFTQLGWVMKIQDTVPPRRPGPLKVTVLTQSLNPHNFEKFIAKIAENTIKKMGIQTTPHASSFMTSGMGAHANPAVLGTAAAGVGVGALAAAATSGTPGAPAAEGTPAAPAAEGTPATEGTPAANAPAAPAPEAPAAEAPAANSGSSGFGFGAAANSSSSNSGSSGFGFGAAANSSSSSSSSNSSSSSSSNTPASGGGTRKRRSKARRARTMRR